MGKSKKEIEIATTATIVVTTNYGPFVSRGRSAYLFIDAIEIGVAQTCTVRMRSETDAFAAVVMGTFLLMDTEQSHVFLLGAPVTRDTGGIFDFMEPPVPYEFSLQYVLNNGTNFQHTSYLQYLGDMGT